MRQLIGEELDKIKASYGPEKFAQRNFARAAELFDTLTTSAQFSRVPDAAGVWLLGLMICGM